MTSLLEELPISVLKFHSIHKDQKARIQQSDSSKVDYELSVHFY